MPEHSSSDLIQAARRQMELRGGSELANRNYESLGSQFRAPSAFDSSGLSQCIFELKQPGGLLPLAPPTARGRLGSFFVRQQARVLWWLVRAIRLRDGALDAASELLRDHEHRLAEMERRVAALETSLRALGGKSDAS